jgi:hypothetical protein
MKFKRYCVTVMDNWTPTREFWTLEGAERWQRSFVAGAHLYRWSGGWVGIAR